MHAPGPSYAGAPSSTGSFSPQLSLKSSGLDEIDPNTISTPPPENQTFNLQISISELQMVKCLNVHPDEIIWDIKTKLFKELPEIIPQAFNYGLFLPPCDLRAGKFLLDDRPIRAYPFHDCAPYVELKYKKRVYKMSNLDKKDMKNLHQPKKLNKFIGYVENGMAVKVEKKCAKGLDPNFHDDHGETPLTLAAGIAGNRNVLVHLVGGGAHLDFRNTPMHKAAFLSLEENVKTLLELGGSPHYQDPMGLTPLYYNMITQDSNPNVAEMLLKEMADVEIVDTQFNLPIHQACKNGLTKHIELLLLYGSDINAQNINGNTPLHITAVHNRVECCRLLLYRGADCTIINKQGETALNVANFVKSIGVAEAIECHDPSRCVAFTGTPKYNTSRRRFTAHHQQQTSLIERRRSLSHSSMSSMQSSSERYQIPQQQQQHHLMNSRTASPMYNPSHMNSNGIYASTNGSIRGDIYSTLKKFPPESINQAAQPGYEPNIPRILVIPRGLKGFGFILRGTNQMEHEMEFIPTPEVPALQFFEGVDKTGMAMRAGLRPGDFLLEINGIDVRCATHAQVVELIHQAQDTITLKVITIEHVSFKNNNDYACTGLSRHPSMNGRCSTLTRNSQAAGMLPPMPPQRNPVTALTFGRVLDGGSFSSHDHYSDSNTMIPNSPATSIKSNYQSSQYIQQSKNQIPISHHHQNNNFDSDTGIYQTSIQHQRQMSGANRNSTISEQQHLRCASVKSRPSPARRISAAELEHLMIRQQGLAPGPSSQFQPPNLEDSTKSSKKFTSVAEMKRRKQRLQQSNSNSLEHSNSFTAQKSMDSEIYADSNEFQEQGQSGPYSLKSFNSSPDLPQASNQSGDRQSLYNQKGGDGDYSRPYKTMLRPKTPPPPPPPLPQQASNVEEKQKINRSPPKGKENSEPASMNSQQQKPGPPAPPPPPPPSFFSKPLVTKSTLQIETETKVRQTESTPKINETTADCRGITAQVLMNVKLKPVSQQSPSKLSQQSSKTLLIEADAVGAAAPISAKKNVDFDLDLKSALARRRSKVNIEISKDMETLKTNPGDIQSNSSIESNSTSQVSALLVKESEMPSTTVGRYDGLSLRETIRENVLAPVKGNSKLAHNHHSPTSGGFATKKDSGYASSRTSLEPSECGDEPSSCNGPHPYALSNGSIPDQKTNSIRISIDSATKNSNNKNSTSTEQTLNSVTLISQRLEDSYGTGSSHGLQSENLNPSRILFLENPSRTPAVDYEDVDEREEDCMEEERETLPICTTDSGNGDSDHEFVDLKKFAISEPNAFSTIPLNKWTTGEVFAWLLSLELLDVYGQCFKEQEITGEKLATFDRTKFTRLGVTRIAHRQAMEKSLRDFIQQQQQLKKI